MLSYFKGRTAPVTGGTHGIGFAIAEALVGAGATVIENSESKDGCTAVAERHGCQSLPADLSDSDAVLRLADAWVRWTISSGTPA